jgi:phenol 2-monooxygenase
MLQNLLFHSNITIQYSTIPVSVEIDASCAHETDGYPVQVSLTRVNNSECKMNGSTANVWLSSPERIRRRLTRTGSQRTPPC